MQKTTAQKTTVGKSHSDINPQLVRLRDSLAGSIQSGLIGNILGAFPENPEAWEQVCQQYGADLDKAITFIANRCIASLARQGVLPVEKPETKGSGYLLGVMGVGHV